MIKNRPDQPDPKERTADENQLDEPTGGEGVGRREDVRGSGVYPASAKEAPSDAIVRTPGEWGKGAGGEEGGSSELHFSDEEIRAIEPDESRTDETEEESEERR